MSLAELHVQSAFTLNETQTSERLLQVLRDRQVASAFILRLQERCALQRGDIRGAAEAVAGQPGTSGELFRLEPFEQWIQAEAGSIERFVGKAKRVVDRRGL